MRPCAFATEDHLKRHPMLRGRLLLLPFPSDDAEQPLERHQILRPMRQRGNPPRQRHIALPFHEPPIDGQCELVKQLANRQIPKLVTAQADLTRLREERAPVPSFVRR